MRNSEASLSAAMRHGVLAGLAGTAVMTAFQKVVEMPLTGRDDSYAPADFAERVFPISAKGPAQRKRLNYVTHFALGGMWGTAFAIASRAGLRGRRAVAVVFPVVYTGDVLLNTALGLYQPSRCPAGNSRSMSSTSWSKHRRPEQCSTGSTFPERCSASVMAASSAAMPPARQTAFGSDPGASLVAAGPRWACGGLAAPVPPPALPFPP